MPDPALRRRVAATDDPILDRAHEVMASTSAWNATLKGVDDEAKLAAERSLISSYRRLFRAIRTAGNPYRRELDADGLRLYRGRQLIFGPPKRVPAPPAPPAAPTPPPEPAPASVVVQLDGGPKRRRVERDREGLITAVIDEPAPES
jgi:hypothetical protein